MFRFQIALAVFCLALLLTIVIQNSDVVELQFLAWGMSVSLVALVFLTAGAGIVIGFMLGKLGGGRKVGARSRG